MGFPLHSMGFSVWDNDPSPCVFEAPDEYDALGKNEASCEGNAPDEYDASCEDNAPGGYDAPGRIEVVR